MKSHAIITIYKTCRLSSHFGFKSTLLLKTKKNKEMISTLNVIANNKNNCEDKFVLVERDPFVVGGIFDGCSTGINSSWASQTLSYLVQLGIQQNKNILDDEFIVEMISQMSELSKSLNLTFAHFLSTCILFTYNKESKVFKIRTFGDCYYYLNDIEYIVDQNNTPDYLGYYLNNPTLTSFLLKYPILSYSDVDRFIVASDGIEKINISQFLSPKHLDPLGILFHPPSSSNYLQRMWNILKKEGYVVNDDLTIISYDTN